MGDKRSSAFDVKCPHCGSRLVIDRELGAVLEHNPPPRPALPQLDEAQRLLQEEARRREQLFQESMAAEKTRSQVLDRKFDEALKKARQEPVERPVRDFDLD